MPLDKKLNYKTFDPTKIHPKSLHGCIKVLDMFAEQFAKKECAMTQRDEKWYGGLMGVSRFLEKLKKQSEVKP